MDLDLPKQMSIPIIEGFGDLERECELQSARWIHVPRSGCLELVMLSYRPCRGVIHVYKGKFRPCYAPEYCEICDEGVGAQVRYGFSVMELRSRQRAMIEFGPAPCKLIAPVVSHCGYLRGLGFRFRKEGGKLKGAILVEALGNPLPDHDLPEAEDVAVHWVRQWQYDAQWAVRPPEVISAADLRPNLNGHAVGASR